MLSGLDAQLVHEHAPRVLVGLERVRLAVAAVEREHQLRSQVLTVGVRGDQSRQAPHDVGVAPAQQIEFDLLLERARPQLVQARDLGLGEGLVGDVGQRRAAPERERALQRVGSLVEAARVQVAAALGDEPLEATRVQMLRIDLEAVAALARDQSALGLVSAPEGSAQP